MMTESLYEEIIASAKVLGIDIGVPELAYFANNSNFSENDVEAVRATFSFLKDRRIEAIVNTLLKLSRLPLKDPKTFENFDFTCIHGRDVERLTALPALSAVYAHKNLAFIGPQGVGKTHLAQAYGRACCEKGLKSYFLKASELSQRFTEARRFGKEGATINFLVKPSCLIIDEVGRCVFDRENTRLFFDLVDRRYSKEGTNCMIFTSNRNPETWADFFSDDSDLKCSLDRIFDDASVFIIKGDSYRGRKLETIRLEAGGMAPARGPVPTK
ncbi:MAG: ATP-binding protein [Clostridia bacterium]|nr:ATP-binding protein [Clostridia bacterium]